MTRPLPERARLRTSLTARTAAQAGRHTITGQTGAAMIGDSRIYKNALDPTLALTGHR
jgi:hypothetical protein